MDQAEPARPGRAQAIARARPGSATREDMARRPCRGAPPPNRGILRECPLREFSMYGKTDECLCYLWDESTQRSPTLM